MFGVVVLLSCVSAWVAPVQRLRRRGGVAVRSSEDGGGKKSLADAIAAFSKGKISRDELESAVRSEEAAAAAQLERERAAKAAAAAAAKQRSAIGAGGLLGALGLVAGGVIEVNTLADVGLAIPLVAGGLLGAARPRARRGAARRACGSARELGWRRAGAPRSAAASPRRPRP